MRLRLTGTCEEINAVLPALTAVLIVQEVSDFRPNRGESVLGRVYLDVAGPAPGSTVNAVRVEAVRTDHGSRPGTGIEPRRRGGDR